MKTVDEIKDEIQVVTSGRDHFKSIRCARKTDNVRVAILAGHEEAAYQERLDALESQLAKVPKRPAA